MNHDLISKWLDLPPDQWPPNHYALLGLPVGEPDIERIEQKVHERLAVLRPYQLNHPDQVTEAMNRLAQAFTVLTDPEAKRSYDASLMPPAPPVPGEVPAPAPPVAPVVPALVREGGDPLSWLFGPWNQGADQPAPAPVTQQDWASTPPPPVRRLSEPEIPVPAAPPPPVVNGPAEAATREAPAAVAPPPPPEPVDPLTEAAQRSPAARRGLGTKRALYRRIGTTRQLIWTWEQLGKYLARPTRKLTKTTEAAELKTLLASLRRLLRAFPPILGGAGQPGYFVDVLARQAMVVPTFRQLLPSQREQLAKDWRDGLDLLLAHRQFLRQEARELRHKPFWGRVSRAARALLTEQPATILLLLALLALLVAIHFQMSR